MTRLIIIRHGETQWNTQFRIQGHTDSALTPTGVRQAAALARRMQSESFDDLVASDLGRAYETARIVAALTGHLIEADAGFRERNFGIGEGLTHGELDHEHPEVFSKVRETDPDYAIPGGESRRQFHERVRSSFEAIAAARTGRRVAIVTHGGVLAALYRVIHGIPISAPHPIPIANASFNAVAWDGARWHVECWGDTAHLADIGALAES